MARDFPNNGDTSHPLPPRGRFRPEVGWWSPSLTRRAREGNLRGVQTFLWIQARSTSEWILRPLRTGSKDSLGWRAKPAPGHSRQNTSRIGVPPASVIGRLSAV